MIKNYEIVFPANYKVGDVVPVNGYKSLNIDLEKIGNLIFYKKKSTDNTLFVMKTNDEKLPLKIELNKNVKLLIKDFSRYKNYNLIKTPYIFPVEKISNSYLEIISIFVILAVVICVVLRVFRHKITKIFYNYQFVKRINKLLLQNNHSAVLRLVNSIDHTKLKKNNLDFCHFYKVECWKNNDPNIFYKKCRRILDEFIS